MNINDLFDPQEQPLDHLCPDGGFSAIFRKIAFVGDSLSSGEFESLSEVGGKVEYHDFYEYSWGQYMARAIGATGYNFSRGGMTAKEYMESFAENNGFWDAEKAAQAYVIALGINDMNPDAGNLPLGSLDDLKDDWRENGDTFIGWFGRIVRRYKEISPDAHFFFVTYANNGLLPPDAPCPGQVKAMRELTDVFSNSYVIDLYRYGPVYDEEFHRHFYMGNHMTPAGYLLTARLVMSYIDYIVRHNLAVFKQVGFIGTPYKNVLASMELTQNRQELPRN